MNTLTTILNQPQLSQHVFTETDLKALSDNSDASRYGLVNKALKKKELIQVRRGLYLLADKYRRQKISQFFLASHIAPHSYISLESALSYHGWIPEHVTLVTSVIHGRSKTFQTPFGEFTYYHLPNNEYEFLTGVNRIEEIENQPFLLASPLRALTDYIYLRKISWQGLGFLTDGLRIELDQLNTIATKDLIAMQNVYSSKRVLQFLTKLRQELKK